MARKRKQIKGVTYIATALRKYKPNSFKNQKSALEKARQIKKELKGESITVSKILSFVVKKRVGKIELPSFLAEPRYYFELVDFPDSIIAETDKRIKFKSKISRNELPMIQGGTPQGLSSQEVYKLYFDGYVNYINKLISQSVTIGNSTWGTNNDDYLIICTKPNAKNVSYIKSVRYDEKGNLVEEDYGFDAENPDFIATKISLEEDETKEEKKKKKTKVVEPAKEEEKPKEDDKKKEDDAVEKNIKLKEKEIELSKQRQKEQKLELKKLDKIAYLMKQGYTKKEIMKLLGK